MEYFVPPKSKRRPKVKGKAKPGHTLRCSKGKWTGATPIAYAYKWYRGGHAITSATMKTYAVTHADKKHSLTCKVKASNPGGHRSRKARKVKVT